MKNLDGNAWVVAFVFGITVVLFSGRSVAQETDPFPEMPVGITSFGGAVCGGHVYVWGGHLGNAHSYYRQGQNATMYRLNLSEPKEWETVLKTENGSQGLAMVAYDDKLFRLGGFVARNDQGDEQDLHSVANFEMYDPTKNQWTSLQDMPEPRSSFDAVVVGNSVYVVGGWKMQGKGNGKPVWSSTAYSFDLSRPDGQWTKLPDPPFRRRAMSVSHQDGKLYVLGGMQERGGPTRLVNVFDPESGEWSEGPALPGESGMDGFGNSSFNIGGRVCVSTYGGTVYKLNKQSNEWIQIGDLDEGRFFHRLLPYSDNQFVLVGGANMETGKKLNVELLDSGQ